MGQSPVIYDGELRLEAYRLQGVSRPFPSHFHDYYVIGLMERGSRRLNCMGREYLVGAGDLLLFNPGDSHGCVQSGGALDYRGMNISAAVMGELAEEVTGRQLLPGFSRPVVDSEVAAGEFRLLHRMVLSGQRSFSKEEHLLCLIARLIQSCGQPFSSCVPACPAEVERVCAYLEEHYPRRITLEDLCRCAGLSKSTLLRAFTRAKGVTPYRYLEAVRVGKARQLLERGVSPVEAALQTGFSDQSHFTNYFSRFTGLTPGAYREIFLAQEKEETDPQAGGETERKMYP